MVGTFAVGWLLPRLPDFQQQHPFIDVRISTNNNRVDMAAGDWTLPFASAVAPGTAQKRCACSTLRFRLCASPNWRTV
ncbi:hypothetical protein ACOJBO_30460 [Rhizobium beringeri]